MGSSEALCEWGLAGMEALRGRAAVLVVVDVLSFSTAVDVVTARGTSVLPFPWGDRAAAKAAAANHGAWLHGPCPRCNISRMIMRSIFCLAARCADVAVSAPSLGRAGEQKTDWTCMRPVGVKRKVI